jgi:hypothetical protein
MISDKFLIYSNKTEKPLDIIENFASCYGFPTKKILQIRLLAEEILAIAAPTMQLSPINAWVTTDEKAFGVVISCDAGEDVMNEKARDTLLEIGKRKVKKGVFGAIAGMFASMAEMDAQYGNYIGRDMLMNYDINGAGYFVIPDLSAFQSSSSLPEQDQDEHDAEISILEGYADHISATFQREWGHRRLEIAVYKNFSEDQLNQVELVK